MRRWSIATVVFLILALLFLIVWASRSQLTTLEGCVEANFFFSQCAGAPPDCYLGYTYISLLNGKYYADQVGVALKDKTLWCNGTSYTLPFSYAPPFLYLERVNGVLGFGADPLTPPSAGCNQTQSSSWFLDNAWLFALIFFILALACILAGYGMSKRRNRGPPPAQKF